MADLKAAAERLRKSADSKSHEIKIWHADNPSHSQYRESLKQSVSDQILAAQALEALAWQSETGASVREMGSGGFFCAVNGEEIVNNYYADTPLGALLAAMEGKKDA